MALKVLLADDSVPAQNMGKKILVDAGFEVWTVGNGLEAMRKIKDFAPDIAILDIFMPGYTGLEVCRFLRADAKTAGMPVILTVGKLEPYRPEDGENVQSNAVIVKPFAAEELTTTVQSLAPASEAASSAPAAEAEPAAEAASELPSQEEAEPEEEAAIEPPPMLSPVWERGSDAAAAEENEVAVAPVTNLVFDPGARSSRFQASVFDDSVEEAVQEESAKEAFAKEAAPQEDSTVGFTLQQSELDEFALLAEQTPELKVVDAGTATQAQSTQSWYGSEDTRSLPDPLLETNAVVSAQPAMQEEAGEESDVPQLEVAAEEPAASAAPVFSEATPAEPPEASISLVLDAADSVESAESLEPAEASNAEPAEPLGVELEEVELEKDAPPAGSAEDSPAIEVIEIEAATPEPEQDTAVEAAFDTVLGSEEPEVATSAAAAAGAADLQAADESSNEQEEARRHAFEQLFNSDVPFPLEEEAKPVGESEPEEISFEPAESQLEPMLAEGEPIEPVAAPSPAEAESIEAELPELKVEAPCELCETNEGEATGSASEEEKAQEDVKEEIKEEVEVEEEADEPLFYGASLNAEVENPESSLPEVAAKSQAAVPETAPERMQLVAEVAKVEALLVQMQAMRQADPTASQSQEANEANFAVPESEASETASLSEIAPVGEADPVAAGAIAAQTAEPEAASQEYVAEDSDPLADARNMAAPSGGEVEVFLPPPQAESGAGDNPAEEPAAAATEAGDSGRIRGAVEKVFERFRPMLVAAIARELAKRD